ncbi:MAG: hypothetical protein MMC33_005788 [Icmadophila ericetorum]|nr:hypothetical protein [Icmadophila ericetorum]
MQRSPIILAILALYAIVASAVQELKVEGSNFVNTVTGDQFQIIGVDYQPGGSAGFNPGSGVDPLSNGTTCLRDAALMQKLGINTIRVYNLDPTLNHDMCVSIFNEVGIYMILDVNTPLPNQSIDSADPSSSYDSVYLEQIFGVVEAFKNYPNLIGFFSGNEVIDDDTTAGVDPPYVRAVTRDLKNYIAKHSTRQIPVGYSAADVENVLTDTWQYFSCAIDGSSTDPSRIDFFGLNSYSWCGNATFISSGYNVLVSDFQDSSVPVFFSEYGCNLVLPRVFSEVQALYSPLMTGVLSGGLVYEYSQEVSNFGLVIINGNGTVTLRVDYDNLQAQYNTLNVKTLESSQALSNETSKTPTTCSPSLIKNPSFYNNFTLPDVPPGGQDLIDNGIQNPNNGKIVTVTTTAVPMAVYAVDGSVISGLAITPLANDQANAPSGQNLTGSGTTTGSGSAASPTKKAAAANLQVQSVFGLIAGFAIVALFL